MQVNVDKKQAFKIAGKPYKLSDRAEAVEYKKEFYENYRERVLEDLGAFYGLMTYNALDQSYDYFLGFELNDQEIIDELELEIREVDESYYLEVPIENEDLEEGYRYTYQEFFPNKKYFHGIGPDVEFYQYDENKNEIGNVELYICLKLNPNA